jgi:hypothetical protein
VFVVRGVQAQREPSPDNVNVEMERSLARLAALNLYSS